MASSTLSSAMFVWIAREGEREGGREREWGEGERGRGEGERMGRGWDRGREGERGYITMDDCSEL